MTDREDEATRRETAAFWYTELQAPNVCPAMWESFLEWESDPANAEAYRQIEATIGAYARAGEHCRVASENDPDWFSEAAVYQQHYFNFELLIITDLNPGTEQKPGADKLISDKLQSPRFTLDVQDSQNRRARIH